MSIFEFFGYLSSVLVFSTFCMKTMIPLRLAGIASNVSFIIYGLIGGLAPIYILHMLLLTGLGLILLILIQVSYREPPHRVTLEIIKSVLKWMTRMAG